MRFKTLASATVVLSLLFAATPVQAQDFNPNESTETTLYFHIWDPFNKFVVNTQPYNASFFDVGGIGFPTSPETGDHNTIRGYATAGPVEYEFVENGRPRIHPERGIAADVIFDTSIEPVTYLYVEARDFFGGEGTPKVLPKMTFDMTMREGDNPGNDQALDDGALIMNGELTAYLYDPSFCASQTATTATFGTGVVLNCLEATEVDPHGESGAGYDDMPQEAADGTPILYPDEDGVIELVIPMTDFPASKIPKDTAYNLRLDWFYRAEGQADDDEYSFGQVRMVLDENHLPRLEFNIMNPVYVEFLHPQVAAGTLLLHAGINSPWGTYDLDLNNLDLSITGPSEPQEVRRVVAQNQHVHGLHDQAAEITYLWKFRDEGAENGEYEVKLDGVTNLAGSATASAVRGFEIQGQKIFADTDGSGDLEELEDRDGDEGEESPGIGIFLIAILGAVAVAARRWLR